MDDTARRSRLSSALKTSGQTHPLVAPLEFQQQTNKRGPKGSQGASINASTGQMLEGGKTDTWMVGGHPGDNGKPVKTTHVAGDGISLLQSISHLNRVKHKTVGQGGAVAAGSWYDADEGRIDLDASTMIANRGQMEQTIQGRTKEKAAFNLKTFEEYENPNYKAPKAKKKTA